MPEILENCCSSAKLVSLKHEDFLTYYMLTCENGSNGTEFGHEPRPQLHFLRCVAITCTIGLCNSLQVLVASPKRLHAQSLYPYHQRREPKHAASLSDFSSRNSPTCRYVLPCLSLSYGNLSESQAPEPPSPSSVLIITILEIQRPLQQRGSFV